MISRQKLRRQNILRQYWHDKTYIAQNLQTTKPIRGKSCIYTRKQENLLLHINCQQGFLNNLSFYYRLCRISFFNAIPIDVILLVPYQIGIIFKHLIWLFSFFAPDDLHGCDQIIDFALVVLMSAVVWKYLTWWIPAWHVLHIKTSDLFV